MPRPANWEEALLTHGLSDRARRSGAAYAGPGAAIEPARSGPPPIYFTGGIPDPAAVPVEALAAASATVLRREGGDALEYGGSQGYGGLRDWLASHFAAIDGVPLTAANFTLTNGSAGALDNVCATFLRPEDVAIVEAPSFPGSIRAIASLGCELVSAAVDADGLDVDALATTLDALASAGRRIKLLYTIASYHNPTGTTLSLARRQRLLELCETHDVLIVEDDAYGELGFEDAPPPSLYGLAGGRGVAKIGSFSKTIATGLRVGWVQATEPLIGALLTTRYDMGLSPWLLRTLAEFVADGRYETHVAGLRALYRRKRDLMLNELAERCSAFARWEEPRGGFFLWLELNDNVDPVRLRELADEEGVAYAGGRSFFADASPASQAAGWSNRPGNADSRFIRLAYSYATLEEIPGGVRRLALAMQRASRD